MSTEITPRSLLVAGFRFPHHSDSSGYHHLAQFLPCTFLDANQFPLGNSCFGTKARRVNMAIFDLWLATRVNKYRIVHYLYPENHCIWSIRKNKNTISIATVHLPVDWLNCTDITSSIWVGMRRKRFKQLNGIVTLSSDQVSIIQKYLPHANVRFIPHGIHPIRIDSYEKPPQDTFRIIIIGSNFRAKEIVFDIAKYALEFKPLWQFDLVGVSGEWKEIAKTYPNVKIHQYLPEIEYFKLLKSSHVHLLPLIFATANNALLEAHVLGVPSLCSALPGISNYAVQTTSYFKKIKEAILLLEKIESMSVEEYHKMREITEREASKFFWPAIAKRVTQFYEDLIHATFKTTDKR